MTYIDQYIFPDVSKRIIQSVAKLRGDSPFGIICDGAYSEYTDVNSCAYNMAMAFVKARKHLDMTVSTNKDYWKWGKVHLKEYSNAPWSMTPLKFLFHHQVPGEGNINTPKVATYKN